VGFPLRGVPQLQRTGAPRPRPATDAVPALPAGVCDLVVGRGVGLTGQNGRRERGEVQKAKWERGEGRETLRARARRPAPERTSPLSPLPFYVVIVVFNILTDRELDNILLPRSIP
jgi:hypothetical protein